MHSERLVKRAARQSSALEVGVEGGGEEREINHSAVTTCPAHEIFLCGQAQHLPKIGSVISDGTHVSAAQRTHEAV